MVLDFESTMSVLVLILIRTAVVCPMKRVKSCLLPSCLKHPHLFMDGMEKYIYDVVGENTKSPENIRKSEVNETLRFIFMMLSIF